ncbi:MAG: hypothetical protein H6765_02870 [Candidatus Peribacteria bacterium]|nr:MAG: hypothetical protein H6765_02870 [Candidatus Peribacteria bacterium]
MGAYVIAFFIVCAFLLLFPFLYMRWGKTIVLWTVISSARAYITQKLLPSFLALVCDNTRKAKEQIQQHGAQVETIWKQRLGKHAWPVRKALSLAMKRVPLLAQLEETIGSIDLSKYSNKEDLQADLQKRLEPYLQKPAGGGA